MVSLNDLMPATGSDADPKGGRSSTASQSGGKRRRSKTARRGKKSRGRKARSMRRGRSCRVCKRKRCHHKKHRGGGSCGTQQIGAGSCSKKHSMKPYHKNKNKKRGGSVVATAALPFGMLALQKFFQTRKGRKDLKKASKTVKRSVRGVSRSVKSVGKSLKRAI